MDPLEPVWVGGPDRAGLEPLGGLYSVACNVIEAPGVEGWTIAFCRDELIHRR